MLCVVLRLWWVLLWDGLWGGRVHEHSGVFQLLLQSSIGPGQHAPPLRQPQHDRRCVSARLTFKASLALRRFNQNRSFKCLISVFQKSGPVLSDVSVCCSSESFQNVHVDICWKRLEEDNMCSSPHQEARTTYAECCCLHGVAWSEQCALCPKGDSGKET